MALTPNMNLLLPTVGVTLGPEWATEVNAALTLIDSHNHVVGQGVPIPTAGIAINADLNFNSYNAIGLRSSRMVNQASPLALVTDLTCLYVSGNNLYYNNAAGQQVQITQGAGLNAASVGGFGGDYGTSTASAFYTSADSTFTFWQAPNQSAIMDMGPMVLHNTDQITFGVTLQAPVGLSASYQLTLPTGLPASRKIMTVDASGNVGDVLDVDGTTLSISGNSIMIANAGVSDVNIATATITVDKMAPMTPTSIAGMNDLMRAGPTGNFSTGSTTYVQPTNLTGTLVTSGRPVYISLVGDATTVSPGFIGVTSNTPSEATVQFSIDGVSQVEQVIRSPLTAGTRFPLSAFALVSLPPTAAMHTITCEVKAVSGSTIEVVNGFLLAYEI